MPDIRVCHELVNKAEVYEIASALDLDVNTVIGILVRVWIWADQHTDDGYSMHSPKLLENIIGVPGLIDALVSVGWLELPGSGFKFPGLHRYTGDGRTTKSRKNKARIDSQNKPRSTNGRFVAKNPASTSTSKDAGPTPGPDRTVPEPNHRTRVLGEALRVKKFLEGDVRDHSHDGGLRPWSRPWPWPTPWTWLWSRSNTRRQ